MAPNLWVIVKAEFELILNGFSFLLWMNRIQKNVWKTKKMFINCVSAEMEPGSLTEDEQFSTIYSSIV